MGNKTQKLRWLLIDPHCAYCGREFAPHSKVTWDHIIPRSKGGRDDSTNRVLCCLRCNQAKANHPPEQIVCLLPRGTGCLPVSEFLKSKGTIMATLAGFNYDALTDEATRRRVKDHARTIRGLVERTGACIVEIGQRLLEVKAELSPRDFAAWLRGEFEWHASMACVHMQAAKRFGNVDCLQLFQPFALYTLSRDNVPNAAIEDAVKLARKGQHITGKRAKEILAKHDVKPTRSDVGVPRKALPAGDVLKTLQRSLDALTGSLETLAGTMPRDQREALADRFLQLALQLRHVQQPAATPAAAAPVKPGRRSKAPAAA